MHAQRHGFRILRVERLDDLGPQQSRRAQLRNLAEVVHPDVEEERNARRKVVDCEPSCEAGAQIFEPVGERVRQLDLLRRARLLHVIAAHADGVESRHFGRRERKEVAHDAHRRLRRVDVSIAHHELFQNVVLNGAAQLFRLDALLLRRNNVERHHRQHRAVHRHGNRNLVERNLIEEDLHVFDRVDRNAGLAHVARDTRAVGIVTAMRGKIKRNGKPFLARGQVAAIERVRFFGGGKPGVLADGPGLRKVHRRVRPAQVGRKPGGVVEVSAHFRSASRRGFSKTHGSRSSSGSMVRRSRARSFGSA